MKKARKKSYAALKRDLDAVFSRWTRLRFADAAGIATCCSCGLRASWRVLQAGHFVSRSYLATRFCPENTATQCVQCNIFKKGNLAAYAAWGVNRYGPDWPARMVSLSKETVKYSRSDLQMMIEDYESRLRQLTQ